MAMGNQGGDFDFNPQNTHNYSNDVENPAMATIPCLYCEDDVVPFLRKNETCACTCSSLISVLVITAVFSVLGGLFCGIVLAIVNAFGVIFPKLYFVICGVLLLTYASFLYEACKKENPEERYLQVCPTCDHVIDRSHKLQSKF